MRRFFRRLGSQLRPHLQGVLVLPNHQHIVKMGTELVPEKSENLHILTQLSARENITEFCRRESFKTNVPIV